MPEKYVQPDKTMRECKYGWFDHWDRLVNGALSLAGTPHIKTEHGEIAIDTHVHTLFSHCSITQPEKLIRWAVKMGLGGICIMDHNDTRGLEDAERCADHLKESQIIPEDFLIIPGVEMNSDCGHVGAIFLRKPLQIGLSPQDMVKAIHDEGGLAVAVHPYHSTGICDAVFDCPFDAIEVECGSVFGAELVCKNRELTDDPRLAGIAKLGASDGHYVRAVASCYTVIKPERITLECVRDSIQRGETIPRASAPCRKMQTLLGGIRKLK